MGIDEFIPIVAGVSPAVWGILSALAFGTADFLARFTSRQFGHHPSLLITLLIGTLVFTPVWLMQPQASWHVQGVSLIVLHGVFFALAMLLLYKVLARGPINVVAPVVAAHPIFIILFAVVLGSRPSLLQWLMIIAVLVCVIVIARQPGSHHSATQSTPENSQYRRQTVLLALVTSVAYAVNVAAAQHAVLISGEWMTIALGHIVATAVLISQRQTWYAYSSIPARWWIPLSLQGFLNASGVLFLLAGSLGSFPEITALLSSEFSVVTIVLAALFLRERMSALQTLAVVGVFAATAVLSL